MKYKFYNLAGKPIWTMEEPSAVGNDTETRMAIQAMFSAGVPPPDDIVVKIGRNVNGMEQWSVGPYDVLVQKER